MSHPASIESEQLLKQCEVRRQKRSGPGGQHRNKVETAIVLRHEPTGIQAEASERRSQAENQKTALFRLRIHLALEVRLPWPADRAPSELWQARCAHGRIAVSDSHADFPAVLAEALDAAAACEFDLKQAGERLGCTTSQLVKLFKQEPRALPFVNRERQTRDLRPLR